MIRRRSPPPDAPLALPTPALALPAPRGEAAALAAAGPDGTINDRWLAVLNGERLVAGLPPMADDPLLEGAAQAWAEAMAEHGVLWHGDFAGRIAAAVGPAPAAEDVAEGTPDVAGVAALWMSSPGHRANMLGRFNRTGIGRAVSPAGATYWCADFDRV